MSLSKYLLTPLIILFLLVPTLSYATNGGTGAGTSGGAGTSILEETPTGLLQKTQLGDSEPPQEKLAATAGNIINTFLFVIGIIFVGLIIYGGYLWMTAAGDSEKISKARDTLTRAIIGLIIILTAYTISRFVVERLT